MGKLDHKYIGPYKVLSIVDTHAYCLKFQMTIKYHLVVHISKLEPIAQDPLPGQVIFPPPLVVIEGNEKWEVEEAIDSHLYYHKL